MDMFQYSIMTPMSNFAMGSYMATTGTIAHGTKIVHLGKFVREDYFDHILKYKVNWAFQEIYFILIFIRANLF